VGLVQACWPKLKALLSECRKRRREWEKENSESFLWQSWLLAWFALALYQPFCLAVESIQSKMAIHDWC